MWCAHTRIAGGVGMSFLKVIESSYIIHPSHSIRRYYIKYTLISSCVVSNVCPRKNKLLPNYCIVRNACFCGPNNISLSHPDQFNLDANEYVVIL